MSQSRKLSTLVVSLAALIGTIALQAQTVYVANNNDHTISVIDGATNTVTATISLPTAPFALAASPDGSRVYAGDLDVDPFSSATIYVIDTSTNSVINTLSTGTGSASSLAVTPDGNTIYATDHHAGHAVRINVATGQVIADFPGLADNAVVTLPNGAAAYAGNADTSTVSAVSTATNTVTATIPVTGFSQQVQQFAATPDGAFVWAPRANANALSIISTATNTVTATIPVPNLPFGVAITPDGKFAYVTQSDFFGGVSVIDTATHAVVATIPAETENPLFAAVSPDGAFVYVSNFEDSSVWVISTATNAIVAKVPVGLRPAGIVVVMPSAGPTSKEQCKNGGWMTFTNPTFKNQGDCVSYFNHLP